MICYANNYQKKDGEVILISDKADFGGKKLSGREGYYVMIMWSLIRRHSQILNVYVPNKRASKYIRQKCIELQEK